MLYLDWTQDGLRPSQLSPENFNPMHPTLEAESNLNNKTRQSTI